MQDKHALLRGNVLALQHKWRHITFDSRAMESYARLMLDKVVIDDGAATEATNGNYVSHA